MRPRLPAWTRDVVEWNNSAESCRVASVIVQEPTEALGTSHRSAMAPQVWLGCDAPVGEALIMALGMTVGQGVVEHG
jgi:hypothetical protein